jgi:asparagine N-glycosylation enzyme membrane subunit Stt3
MLALTFFALRRGADAPYLALKMFYFAVYLQAVAAAVVVAEVWRLLEKPLGAILGRFAFRKSAATVIAWLVLLTLAIRVGRPAVAAPRPVPVLSESLYRAGLWARANVPPDCVEYLVGHPDAAYWLHLAVLGNPRISARTGRDDTYDPKTAIVRWLTPGSLRYGIADLRTLPRDVRADLHVIADFGDAAVVEHPSTNCPADQRSAR